MGSFGEKTFRAPLSLLGEFADRELEKEYADHEIKCSIGFVRPAVLLLGVLYFLFVIADYFFIEDSQVFNSLLLNRVLFLVVSILFSLWLKTNNRSRDYYLSVTAYEIIG